MLPGPFEHFSFPLVSFSVEFRPRQLSSALRAALRRFEFSEILAKSVEIHVFQASQLRKLSFFVLDAREAREEDLD